MICKYYVIPIIVIVTLLIKSSAAQECDPTVACSLGEAGDFVIDPIDCHNFYVCITGEDGVIPSTHPVSCNVGTYFDADNMTCYEEITPCLNPCVNYECDHVCNGMTNHLIAYPNDCSKYYLCFPDGTALEETCSGTKKYFNGKTCIDVPYSCCDICTPYCEIAFTEVYDPLDCHSYYLCIDDDYIPTNETRFICPSGQQFDEFTLTCADITNQDCTSICSNNTKDKPLGITA